MAKIKVLVVEDSITVRRHLCDVLSSDPDIDVVGEAEDGKRAIELCQQLRPNVITLDMILPVMSGLAATEYIMAHCPTPILIVSSSTNRGELFKTYEALAAGAVDAMEKPAGEQPRDWEEVIARVKLISRIKVITHPRARLSGLSRIGQQPGTLSHTPPSSPRSETLVVGIGASTGGPLAIVSILRSLPARLRSAVLIVLHIGEPFGTALAEWLDGQTSHRVCYARDGEPIESSFGRITMAPPDRHLEIRNGRLRLTDGPERYSCRPSVDVLFESIAREYGSEGAGCLLTGMGKDGATGLLRIRNFGGITIAQDEATSVVYGMPREAVMLGAAESILPLDEIGPAIASMVKGNDRSDRR